MRAWILGLVLCVLALPAWAFDSYRFGANVVVVGDSAGRLTRIAGRPDRIVQLENRHGAAVGQRWEYDVDGKTVAFTFEGGRIVSIDEFR